MKPPCRSKINLALVKSQGKSSTYDIKKIVVSAVKMLIKKLFSTETFPTISTPPFIYIHMNLVLLLIPKHIIVLMKPTLIRNLKSFLLYKRHQILFKKKVISHTNNLNSTKYFIGLQTLPPL